MSEKITITEALAEIKTIDKRIAKKQEFIIPLVWRQEAMRDPHEKDGGSAMIVKSELQSVNDLQERVVNIRRAIQDANVANTITIGKTERSIADWLVWRRDVMPSQKHLIQQMISAVLNIRREATIKGLQVNVNETGQLQDVVVNVNEKDMAEQSEHMEEVDGILDGQLSLKNATIFIEL